MGLYVPYAEKRDTGALFRPGPIIDSSLVLFAPLWHPDLSYSPFTTKDATKHSGTVTGATWGPQGRSFDGVTDEINCGNIVPLSGAGTLALWFKNNDGGSSASDNIFYAKRSGGVTNYQISLRIAGTPGIAYYDGVTQQFSGYIPTVGSFEYLSFRRTAANTIVFAANCVDKYTFTLDWGTGTGAGLYFGGDSAIGSNFQKCTIGEAYAYNRLLTNAEDMHNYLATKWRYAA